MFLERQNYISELHLTSSASGSMDDGGSRKRSEASQTIGGILPTESKTSKDNVFQGRNYVEAEETVASSLFSALIIVAGLRVGERSRDKGVHAHVYA